MDKAAEVRAAAAGALNRIDRYWHHSSAAQDVIGKLKSALKDKEYWVRQSAAEVLSRIGQGDREETQFVTFINAAQLRRKTAVSVFAELLCDLERDVRQAAAESLGRIGDPGAVEVLHLAKDDSDETERLAGAAGLDRSAKLMRNTIACRGPFDRPGLPRDEPGWSLKHRYIPDDL